MRSAEQEQVKQFQRLGVDAVDEFLLKLQLGFGFERGGKHGARGGAAAREIVLGSVGILRDVVLRFQFGPAERNEDRAELLDGDHAVHAGTGERFETLGDARPDEDIDGVGIEFAGFLSGKRHRTRNGRQVRTHGGKMTAHKFDERGTAGVGDELAAELHLADEFLRGHARRGLGGFGDLDDLRKADLPQRPEQLFASAGKLMERRRGDERDRLAAFGQETQHGNEFGPLHDGAVGAGTETFAAERAFFEVDLGKALFVFADRADRAGGFARDREPLDGVVEADVDETLAALGAGFLIDERLAAHDVDGVVRADMNAGLRETVAAEALDHLDLRIGAAGTCRPGDREGAFRAFRIRGDQPEVFVRETAVVLFVLRIQAKERHDAAADHLAVMRQTAVKRLRAGRLHEERKLVDRILERAVPELAGDPDHEFAALAFGTVGILHVHASCLFMISVMASQTDSSVAF